jgi:ribonuclease R
MNIAPDGEISSFRFCKSAIRSRVKGVYTEINSILDGTASPEIIEKYSTVSDCFPVMNELADILTAKRKRRGSPELNTPESKIITDENGICIDVKPRISGKSERIIEEFMLSANESAARLAREKKIPFVYRVHENPPEEKIYNLCEILTKFNIKYPLFTDFKPSHAAEILRNVEGTEYDEAVNLMLLRAMAKAEYSHEPLGHFGLALDDYAHFTSPIRRYPDLAIHRIITDVLAGYDETWLNKRYGGFVGKAAENSSNAEVKAVSIERLCENYYKAEFMKSRLGESFEGRISSVTSFGFYVTLENTIEGLVHVRSLPEGEYDYSEPTTLTERFSGVSYKLGDTVRVICAAANVSDGKIDFVLDDE